MSRFIEGLRRCVEPTLFGAIAISAMGGAAALVADDVIHAPRPSDSLASASVRAPQVAGLAGAIPGPVPAAKSVAAAEAAAEFRGDMTDVTLFQTVPVQFGNGPGYGVVTGAAYATSKASRPLRQWCYVQAGNLSAAAQATVTLASKEGDGTVERVKLEEADARAVRLPLQSLQDALASCRFM